MPIYYHYFNLITSNSTDFGLEVFNFFLQFHATAFEYQVSVGEPHCVSEPNKLHQLWNLFISKKISRSWIQRLDTCKSSLCMHEYAHSTIDQSYAYVCAVWNTTHKCALLFYKSSMYKRTREAMVAREMRNEKMFRLTIGRLFTAPTIALTTYRPRSAPPAYRRAWLLSSTPSHCKCQRKQDVVAARSKKHKH